MVARNDRLPDPYLVRDIVRAAVDKYGTGFKHGDWTIPKDQWEEIVQFVIQEVYDREG